MKPKAHISGVIGIGFETIEEISAVKPISTTILKYYVEIVKPISTWQFKKEVCDGGLLLPFI